ncbi:MAG: thioredoxin family protein [Anaerolineales bacterium]
MPLELNTPVPDFTLPDLAGNIHILSDYRDKIVIINFWSAECPHSERTDKELLDYLKDWNEQVALLSIASNGNKAPEMLAAAARRRGLQPVLTDPDHSVADRFDALTTPHIFIVDESGILRYRGAFDDVTFRQREPTRNYLKEAIEALLEKRPPAVTETQPFGCTIARI